MHTRLILAASLLASLAGCGDPKAANKTNFKSVLADHFAHHCIFVTPSVGLNAFPVTVSDASETGRYDALVSAGLLTSRSQATEHPGVLGIGTVREQSETYDLTPTGRSLFQNGAGENDRGFCAGHYLVDDVRDFTPPATSGGQTMSDVTFDVTPQLADWVKNADVQARYGDELAAVKPTADRATLVQTDKGWTFPTPAMGQ